MTNQPPTQITQADCEAVEAINAAIFDEGYFPTNRILQIVARYREASLAQSPEGIGWRGIESAPKDGTLVDLWAYWSENDTWRRTPDAFWNGQNWQLGDFNEAQFLYPPRITLWQLITPPSTNGEKAS